jgi:hypothetical protein
MQLAYIRRSKIREARSVISQNHSLLEQEVEQF